LIDLEQPDSRMSGREEDKARIIWTCHLPQSDLAHTQHSQTRPNVMSKAPSFSNVVSSLVRAQMGSSVPANTLDEELDRRVAELILKEARQKEARHGKTGSYSPQP
jgi:hypothetical protein